MMTSPRRLEGPALLEHPIAAAVILAVGERGYELATVSDFCERSGISRTEFDALFSDKAEVTLRVLEAYIEDFKCRLRRAYASEPGWPANLRAVAYETARWIRDNPAASRFGMVAVLDAGDMARVRREETFKWCADLIDEGRGVAPDPTAVPAAAPLMAVGAVAETLRRVEDGAVQLGIAETVAPMMYWAVRPYLGEEAALQEFEMPLPPDLAAGEG